MAVRGCKSIGTKTETPRPKTLQRFTITLGKVSDQTRKRITTKVAKQASRENSKKLSRWLRPQEAEFKWWIAALHQAQVTCGEVCPEGRLRVKESRTANEMKVRSPPHEQTKAFLPRSAMMYGPAVRRKMMLAD